MAVARGFEAKTQLEPREKLLCAFLHLEHGVAQHTLVAMFGVNQGRINDAISEVKRAIAWETIATDRSQVIDING